MKKFLLFFVCLVCGINAAMAQDWDFDFSDVVPLGQRLYYKITDEPNKIVYIVAGPEKPDGNLVIPATVEYNSKTYTVEGIRDRAFEGCIGLTSVTFPMAATFTTIGVDPSMSFTFMGCNSITSFVIPDNVTSIGGQAFRETGITSISIGKGVTTIPDDAFFWCYKLKRIVLPDNVTAIGEYAFSGSGVKYVELGNAIADGFNPKAFGNGTGTYASSIDTVVINTVVPPTVNGSFDVNFANRCILYIPVGSKAAYKAADGWKDFRFILEKGEELVLHEIIVDGYAPIEGAIFTVDGFEYASTNFSFNCAHDENFTIQVKIDNKAYGLKQVLFGSEDVTAQFDAENKATFKATANATLKFTYVQLVHPYDFTEVVPSGQTLYFKIIDAPNYKVAVCNQSGGRATSGYITPGYDAETTPPSGDVVIPPTITHDEIEYAIEEIDTLAFKGSYITSLTLHDGIKAIRASAVLDTYCGTGTKLTIPAQCKRIEYGAFRDCRYNAVNTGGAEIIEQYAFLFCPLTEIVTTSALKEFGADVCKTGELKTVELGENVEFVNSAAFSNCVNIETITIHAVTPPVVGYSKTEPTTGWRYFDPSARKLIVPWSSDHSVIADYKNADAWKLFGTIVEADHTPTSLDEIVNRNSSNRKLIRDGQLFIFRDGKMYNAQGVEVR